MKRTNERIKPRVGKRMQAIRFLRSWRGYAVGAIIRPPGGMREILLRATDPLGNPIVETVVEEPPEQEQKTLHLPKSKTADAEGPEE